MINAKTNTLSGFGFVTIDYQGDPAKIFQAEHYINDSKIDCQPALDRNQAKKKEEDERKRKLFVGGLPKNLPDSELYHYFLQFG